MQKIKNFFMAWGECILWCLVYVAWLVFCYFLGTKIKTLLQLFVALVLSYFVGYKLGGLIVESYLKGQIRQAAYKAKMKADSIHKPFAYSHQGD